MIIKTKGYTFVTGFYQTPVSQVFHATGESTSTTVELNIQF